MKKDLSVYLKDIINSCDTIQNYISGKSRENFYNDEILQDAIIRRLEIIGEAVKRLPQDFRNNHNDIRWSGPSGMRDILIHNYDEVEIEQVWETITAILPPFRAQIQVLLDNIQV